MTCHGYVENLHSLALRLATDSDEGPDATKKKTKSGKKKKKKSENVVWPPYEELTEITDARYGQMPKNT